MRDLQPFNRRRIFLLRDRRRWKTIIRSNSKSCSVASPHLTKSRYIAGLQCLRRLWLLVNEPKSYEEPPPGSPIDIGKEIGGKPHLLFPGGALIDEEPWLHAQTVALTTALMADARVPVIFEGAFEYDGIRIHVDVLERLANGAWGLREVKSSTRPKDYHLDDIALQLYVLKGAGIAVSSVELVHVNADYVRGPGGVSWPEFFARVDVNEAVERRLADLPTRLPAMRECLGRDEPPYAEPGSQCSKPYDCASDRYVFPRAVRPLAANDDPERFVRQRALQRLRLGQPFSEFLLTGCLPGSSPTDSSSDRSKQPIEIIGAPGEA
jgi:hypothetical protein